MPYQCWKGLVQISLSIVRDSLGLSGFLTGLFFLSLYNNFGLIGNHLIIINMKTRLVTIEAHTLCLQASIIRLRYFVHGRKRLNRAIVK